MATIVITQNNPLEHAKVDIDGFENIRDILAVLQVVETHIRNQYFSSLVLPPENTPTPGQTELPLN